MRLPVVNKTAWVNPGNRPDRTTARGTSIGSSLRASIGGKAVHMTAPGIAAVMTAPRMFAPAALAPLAPPELAPPKLRRRPQPPIGVVRVDWTPASIAPSVPKPRAARPTGPSPFCPWPRIEPSRPSMCPRCGLWFESRKPRGRHQFTCSMEGAD
jgi:hypothetical protein